MTPEPAIVPSLTFSAGNVFLDLHNAGDGAAIDVNLTIEWTLRTDYPITVTLASPGRTRWRASVLPAGRMVRFNPPQVAEAGHLQGQSLNYFARIAVQGTARNARGHSLSIGTIIDEPGAVYQSEVESMRHYTSNYEPAEIVAGEMRKITELLKVLAKGTAP
jgi:hypothetical protein